MILKLFHNFLKKLKKENLKTIKLPKFDKSIDDRCNKKMWYKIKSRPDVVILEGWCVGARAQKKSQIKKTHKLTRKS